MITSSLTQISLSFDFNPDSIFNLLLGISKQFEKKFITALLAYPSTGLAFIFNLKIPSAPSNNFSISSDILNFN